MPLISTPDLIIIAIISLTASAILLGLGAIALLMAGVRSLAQRGTFLG
jgi:hypothetical protein